MLALPLVAITFYGCGNTMEEVHIFDRKQLPAQTIRQGHILRSEKGVLQLEMTTPLMLKYMEPEEKTLYPKGVEVVFYDEAQQAKAFFTAGDVVSWDAQHRVFAKDSVVIIDYRSHDTVYLQDLVWDSQEKRVYSEHPVRSVNGQRITYGDSFESDDAFKNPIIIHQRGTVEWNDSTDTQ